MSKISIWCVLGYWVVAKAVLTATGGTGNLFACSLAVVGWMIMWVYCLARDRAEGRTPNCKDPD